MAGLADATKYSYQTWSDATRYLLNVGGAVNAATQVDATFAEVFAAPGY